MAGPVIGVVGGNGGVGASSFAAVLARVAGAMLIDLDAAGGGIDVLLGIEDAPGARWSGLRLGGGRLDPELLRSGLPRWGEVPVLAADAPPVTEYVPTVVDAAAALGAVVLDLPRCVPSSGPTSKAAACCDLVVVLASAEPRRLVAARAVVVGLPSVTLGVVLRPGAVPTELAAAHLGIPLLGALAKPRFATKVAAEVLAGLGLGVPR